MLTVKIIHLALGKANPERQNGVNKVIYELASTQASKGFDVEFWGITKDVTINFPPRVFVTKLFEDKSNKFSLDLALVKEIENLIYEDKPCIFHLHGGFTPQLVKVAKILKNYDINYLITPHGAYNEIAIQRSFIKKRIFHFFYEKKYIQHAAIVHLLGQSEIYGLNKLNPNKEYCLIPNGQSKINYSEVPIETDEVIRFAYVGRLDAYGKGLMEMLDGFSQFLLKTNKKAELHIIGDGFEKYKLLKKVDQLNLKSAIIFHGALFDQQKWNVFRKISALILPSRGEGIPGVVLEALYFGKPVIVSKETNLSQIVRENNVGIELKEISKKEISKSMLKLSKWNQNQFDECAMNAKNLIATEFNWRTISDHLNEIYTHIIHA